MYVSIKVIAYLVVFSALYCANETAQPFNKRTQQLASDRLMYPEEFDYRSGVNLSLLGHNQPVDEDYYDELARQRKKVEPPAPSQNKSQIPLSLIREINDKNFTINELLRHYVGNYEDLFRENRLREEEEGGIKTATDAGCMPEYKTINLVQNKDPSIFYIPSCTRVEQCGGCCNSEILECQPVEVEPVNVQVLKASYNGGNSKKFSHIGTEIVAIERHKQCKCLCRVKAKDCTLMQVYEEVTCKCTCKNKDEEKKCLNEHSVKLWNSNTCSCQCRNESLCTTGSEFDSNQCKCVVKQIRRNVEQHRRFSYKNLY